MKKGFLLILTVGLLISILVRLHLRQNPGVQKWEVLSLSASIMQVITQNTCGRSSAFCSPIPIPKMKWLAVHTTGYGEAKPELRSVRTKEVPWGLKLITLLEPIPGATSQQNSVEEMGGLKKRTVTGW